MKFLTKNCMARKILIILLVALILIFAITPNYSVQAAPSEGAGSDSDTTYIDEAPDAGGGIVGSLLKQLIQIIVSLGDIVMGALNYFMLGADSFSSSMLSPDNENLDNTSSWLYVGDDEEIDVEFAPGTINTSEFFSWITGTQFDIPNMLYSPENIFANNIAALDINFLHPNTYSSVIVSGETNEEERAEEASQSSAGSVLRETIASWYQSFRNIAVVGLLSVLVYLGIRILISSTAVDKAKYKESLRDWLVALCLVFVIHFIMSGILMIVDRFNELFSASIDSGITIKAYQDGEEVKFRTNLVGYARFSAQSSSLYNTTAFSLIYLVLVIYTCVFTFTYFRRFLYMAFFTMIAPLVALTYPIDRAGDGKSQAFNMWFKEYTMNVVIQPVHLILYTVFVSSAMKLVEQNMIYALVAIGFLIPAEKFIKQMFGLDKAQTTSSLGAFAGGAMAMSGMKQLASALGGKNKSKGNSSGGSGADQSGNDSQNRINTVENGFLSSYEDNDGSDGRSTIRGLTDDERAERDRLDQELENVDNNELYMNPEYQAKQERWMELNRKEQEKEQSQTQSQTQTQSQNEAEETGKPSLKDRAKNAWGFGKKVIPNHVKRLGKVSYKGAKLATRGLGMAGGAMVGLAAGVASGDFSNALTYAGAGALAGGTIGRTVANAPEALVNGTVSARDAISNKVENERYELEKAQFGAAEAARRAASRANERERNRFIKDKGEKAKYEEMAGRIKASTR